MWKEEPKMEIDYDQDEIPYNDAVERAREIVSDMEPSHFELGALANKLEPKYGEDTLLQFAGDIGLPFDR
jgi:hypothetical protein